ncbi:TPA: phosphotransferase [Legionella pneumophila]|nr:phosphotransferase [Legionella pneumophila]HEH5931134.1 phosphotransferase [Legionella pneumophila]HEH5937516.1 phosphotransferase [Legionella pneumophila]HEH5940875.1 phosphotransferase [Legionella pneumophila]HEH5944189.1 phosphotransferase [Legionella pneumophila]
MNKNQISKICETFNLGIALHDPVPVSGGLIHRMWRIDTNHGSFAIKELDPAIMQRSGIHNIYIQSEKIAATLKKEGIPVATAITKNNTPLYETDGITVMVYPWVEGKTLTLDQVTTKHANKIGTVVAAIHAANIKLFDLPIPEVHSISVEHWHNLVEKALNNKLAWADVANTNLPDLIIWSDLYQKAQQRLNKHLIISHTDMDPKNVIWHDEVSPVLIDWEGAGLANPTAEIMNVAIGWSGETELLFRENIFSAIIEGYCNAGGYIIKDDMPDAFYRLIGGYLAWLEFNMTRSLDSSEYKVDVQNRGIRETLITIKKLNFLSRNIDTFISLSNL